MQNRIKIIILFAILYLAFLHSFKINAQARLVMNNNAYLVIDNSAKLVVANGNTNAITTSGTGGNLVTESESDQLKWMIGNNTGNFIIPFTNGNGVKIPFTYTVNSGGAGSGSVLFSTYGSSNWQNSSYLPTDVTHFNNETTLMDNSAFAIDRFWIIDATGYSTKPDVTLNFTYDDNEHLNAGNTINEIDLAAQRFNNTSDTWGDFSPAGIVNTVSNTVVSVNVPASHFYRSWTLLDSDNPMPVELLFYEFECDGNSVLLQWTTMSETNNDYFTIESSDNGFSFISEYTVAGSGNSSAMQNYSLRADPGKYYRLTQTDFNGMKEELGTLFAGCNGNAELVYWQSIEKLNEIRIGGLEEGDLVYQLFDMSGKLVVQESRTVQEGNELLRLPELANGIYTISLKNNEREIAGKVMMVK